MKHILILTVLLFSKPLLSQEISTSVVTGVPVSASLNWDNPNFFVKSDLMLALKEKSQIGFGISYVSIDLLPSDNVLTFDTKNVSVYSSYKYSMKLNDFLELVPQFSLGYSFVRSQLNEFFDPEQKAKGIYLSEELHIKFKLTDKIKVFTGFCMATTFTKLRTHPDLIVTDNMIRNKKNYINQFLFNIGINIKIK